LRYNTIKDKGTGDLSHSPAFFPQHSGTNQHPHLKKQKPSTFTDIISDSLASGAFTPRWLSAPWTSDTSKHIMSGTPRPANLSNSLPHTTPHSGQARH